MSLSTRSVAGGSSCCGITVVAHAYCCWSGDRAWASAHPLSLSRRHRSRRWGHRSRCARAGSDVSARQSPEAEHRPAQTLLLEPHVPRALNSALVMSSGSESLLSAAVDGSGSAVQSSVREQGGGVHQEAAHAARARASGRGSPASSASRAGRTRAVNSPHKEKWVVRAATTFRLRRVCPSRVRRAQTTRAAGTTALPSPHGRERRCSTPRDRPAREARGADLGWLLAPLGTSSTLLHRPRPARGCGAHARGTGRTARRFRGAIFNRTL